MLTKKHQKVGLDTAFVYRKRIPEVLDHCICSRHVATVDYVSKLTK